MVVTGARAQRVALQTDSANDILGTRHGVQLSTTLAPPASVQTGGTSKPATATAAATAGDELHASSELSADSALLTPQASNIAAPTDVAIDVALDD